MKLSGFFFVLICIPLLMAGCGSSGDEQENYAADIVGTYSGYSVGKFQYSTPAVTSGESVVITESGGGRATVEFVSSMWGVIRIPDVEVTDMGNRYDLAGSADIEMEMPSRASTYNVTITGNVRGTNTVFLKFTLPEVMGGLIIEFNTGTMPAHFKVMGKYDGQSTGSSKHSPDPVFTENETLAITYDKQLVFNAPEWGNFVSDELDVKWTANSYSISGEGWVTMGISEEKPDGYEFFFTMAGTVSADGDADITFEVPGVYGGIVLVFSGQRSE